MRIEPGTAVLVARGNAAAKLQAEALPGSDRGASAHPPARLVGRLGCDRRRPGARARRCAGVPLERGLHHVAARSARPANGGRPARGRRHRAPHDRRTAAGPLRRDDELRARAGARPLRRRAWDGARRRRLVDARFRGNRAELAVRRTRARRLDRAHAPVLRRLRAAARSRPSSRRTATESPRRRSSRTRSSGRRP